MNQDGRIFGLVVMLLLGVWGRSTAWAFPDYVGSRALGMGGAGRADARGDEGPLLNPAGMSLGKLYTVEGGYQFASRGGGHVARAAVVDSTSVFRVGGGLYYNYRTGSPAGVPKVSGHEAGLALSYPIGDHLMFGATAKYFRVRGGAFDETGAVDEASGFTVDAGAIARLGTMLSIGAAGYNLRDLHSRQAPVGVGYGVAFNPGSKVAVVLDSFHDLTTDDSARGVRTSIGGGIEYTFEGKISLRLGGGRDGGANHGFLSAGVATMSELGAIDLGLRQDITGEGKQTFFAAGLRLFVPQ